MAKSGIDYFPLDVALDRKFELIEAEFGLTGFGVVVHLLQEIYGREGYYIEWTQEVALLFARKVGLGGGVVSEIIEASVRRGMFDKKIFDKYQVLTSSGIQRRYFEAVSRRKILEVDYNILLVDVAQICPNADIRRKNVNILSQNADISKQSKVEKSKVEYTPPVSPPRGDAAGGESAFDRFWNAYPRKVGKDAALRAFRKVKAPVEDLLAAVERQKRGDQWTRENGRFIPNPATWLNQGRWKDEVQDGRRSGREPDERAREDMERLRRLMERMKREEGS